MACEQLWPRLRDSRKVCDQRLRDPRVIALPSGAKKRVIGGVANEGVLEAVNWRRDALPEDQARLQHQVELAPYGILWRLCNGHEQIMGELASQRGAQLEERPRLAEPIDARHERRFHRGRDHFG